MQAFPCNRGFFGQEPLKNEQLADHFASKGLTFPVFAKVNSNGGAADSLFEWLKSEAPGTLTDAVKWNFTKYLVVNGVPVKRYGPNESPLSFEGDILEALRVARSATSTSITE